MLDAGTQARFARSCSDAMFGYANTAAATYASMTAQTFDMWTATLRAMAPQAEEPRSWYRHPDERARRPVVHPFLAAWMPASASTRTTTPFAFWMQPAAPAASLDAWFAPWTTWFGMWSGPRAASAGPMAFVMVAGGVPQSIAVPAAEAHAAALEAAGIASDQLGQVFAQYRSESGYAMAQVVAPRRRTVDAPVPAPKPRAPLPMWPWLH